MKIFFNFKCLNIEFIRTNFDPKKKKKKAQNRELINHIKKNNETLNYYLFFLRSLLLQS